MIVAMLLTCQLAFDLPRECYRGKRRGEGTTMTASFFRHTDRWKD